MDGSNDILPRGNVHPATPRSFILTGDSLGSGLSHRRTSRPTTRVKGFMRVGRISSCHPQLPRDNNDQGEDWLFAAGGKAGKSTLASITTASAPESLPPNRLIPLLTPPEDPDACKWATEYTPTQDSTNTISDTHLTGKSLLSAAVVSMALQAGEGKLPETEPLELSTSQGTDGHQGTASSTFANSSLGSGETYSWFDVSIGAAVTVDPTDPYLTALQIVSQTLPTPAKESSRPSALFRDVIDAIQSRFDTVHQPYITITHAVPPRFDLLNLPGSPPSTPNLSVGREDYFNQSIFAHAAVVPTHYTCNNMVMAAPSSPHQIVPPSSVHISILERYIPPSSRQECRELFSLTNPSVLIDRLAELSPDGGNMLFIYPTKAGSGMFTSQYLSPILDPLLRSLVEVHQLSYSLAESLGSMEAIADMHDFETMQAKLVALCRQMSHHQTTSRTRRSRFHLVHANTGHVAIDRRTWTDWYLKQEHPRFRRTLDTYWGLGNRLSQVESATSGTVLRAVLDGVNKMTTDEADQTGAGIEMAVFVIRRSLVTSSQEIRTEDHSLWEGGDGSGA